MENFKERPSPTGSSEDNNLDEIITRTYGPADVKQKVGTLMLRELIISESIKKGCKIDSEVALGLLREKNPELYAIYSGLNNLNGGLRRKKKNCKTKRKYRSSTKRGSSHCKRKH
jgi:hypothetical protein